MRYAMPVAMAPLGRIMKLVDEVRLGTKINSRLMTVSGMTAIFMLLRKYLYAIAPNSAGTTFSNAG